MIKKTLFNFAMIQTTMILMSLGLGRQWGPFTDTGVPVAMGFFYALLLIYSLFPSIIVAALFAFIQKRFYEKR